MIRLIRLTKKQKETCALLYLSDKEIADRLGITHHAVRKRLTNLYRKTGARNKTELLGMVCYFSRDFASAALDLPRVSPKVSSRRR